MARSEKQASVSEALTGVAPYAHPGTFSLAEALEMAAILCDIKEEDEVIVPSYTFVSSGNAFALRGA